MRSKENILVLVLACFAGVRCGSTPSKPSAVPTVAPTPEPSARYQVTFQATWSAATHAVPPDPHFSRLIGGTHNASVRFWGAGLMASDGIEAMAERGA